MAKAKYTEEEVTRLLFLYDEKGNEGLEEIAEALGKTPASVRSKLVTEGAYVVSEKPASKRKTEGPTKKELIRELTVLTGSDLKGIEGATKSALSELIVAVKARGE